MDANDRLEELRLLLAPAGGGVHTVSAGKAEQEALQRALYGVDSTAEILPTWHRGLENLAAARVLILGVPSDTGAGFTRGANQGPAGIRGHLLTSEAHPARGPEVFDVGDIRVVPHFLADDMLSEAQRQKSQRALYGEDAPDLPVAPLDMTRRVLDHLRALAPNARPIVLGGDHSVGWPAFAASWQALEVDGDHHLGLLHFDAHTDLLPDRLGVDICFGTWAWHANEALGRDGRLVQVGIRQSGQDRAHWESTLGVRQYWPDELSARSLEDLVDEITERFQARGVDRLYVSNDIDGTDMTFAAATGTPAEGGPTPELVSGLTRGLAARFPLVGADLVEVAPPLTWGREGEPERTLDTACRYLGDLVDAPSIS